MTDLLNEILVEKLALAETEIATAAKVIAAQKTELSRLTALSDKYKSVIQRQHSIIEAAGLLSKGEQADEAAERTFEAMAKETV